MADMLSTFVIFVRKTLKEKKYYWLRNVVYTIFPLVLVALLINLDVVVDPAQPLTDGNASEVTRISAPITTQFLLDHHFPGGLEDKILYAPNTSFTFNLIEKMRVDNDILDERVMGFASEEDMWKIYDVTPKFFAIIFELNEADGVPKNLKYMIRTRNNHFKTNLQFSKNLNEIYQKLGNEYITSGFAALEFAIGETFLKMQKVDLFTIELERFPDPAVQHQTSKILEFGKYVVLFSSIILIYLVIIRLVEEKACGFKEQLKNATRFSYLNNFALFFVNLLQLLTIIYLCFLITYAKNLWDLIDFFYPVMLILLFSISIICYTFLISAFFESIVFSSIGAIFWYFVPFIAFDLATNDWKKILVVFPLNAFYAGMSIFNDFSNSGHQFNPSSVLELSHPNEGIFTMFDIFFNLALSSFVSVFLYFYVSNVWPGRYGIPQSFFFIFQKSFYFANKIDCHSDESTLNFTANGFENFSHLKAIVKIRNLSKTYRSCTGPDKTVVKNLSLDIYKNQITVLLGHNGAGKTTTMCMMTGLIPKTCGHIIVDGVDNISFYRSIIGYCPQHNIFLPYLTCQEHLEFFGQLRGLSRFNAEVEATQILNKVNLSSKAHSVAKTLSGGMMRKLCLGNAIIGNTKLLILDEPSSGLDPESRRDIWNILLKLKKDHTILITTHFMEEAEVLGDKIAIMESGELISYGTSMFLKQYYGSGYTLKLLKNIERNNFDQTSVHNTIRRHIPAAARRESVEPLYCMTLPYQDQKLYCGVLKELEMNKTELGIESLSITNTTLEEVFLNSASLKINNDRDEIDSHYIELQQQVEIKNFNKNYILMQQFLATFYKKTIYWKRNIGFVLCMIMIPILITLFCFLLKNAAKPTQHSSLNLEILNIPKPLVIVNFRNGDDYKLENTVKRYLEGENAEVWITKREQVEDEIIELADKDLLRYYDNLVAAFDFESSSSVKCLYSQNLLHSSAMVINMALNIMSKYGLSSEHTIEVLNSPLTREDSNANRLQLTYIEFVPIGLMLYMILYLPFTYKETSTGFKKLLNIPSWVYWFSLYLGDVLLHTFVWVVVMFITKFYEEDLQFDGEALTSISMLFLIYGYTYLVIIYIVSQCFNSLNSSITFLSYLQMISLFGVIILSSSLENMKSFSGCITMLHILPDFSLKHSLKSIFEHQKFINERKQFGVALDSEAFLQKHREYEDVFDLSQFYIINFIVFLVGSIFLLKIVENMYIMETLGRFCTKMQLCNFGCGEEKPKKKGDLQLEDFVDDADVLSEKSQVEEIIREDNIKDHAMVVSKLVKSFDGVKAVRGISFTVKKGEIFGLLGMNGAGKTTTFEMMTLNQTKSGGKVFLNGIDSDQDRFLYRHQFGYCPQIDALNDYMTAYEMLKYVLMISGSCSNFLDEEINMWLRKIDIVEYSNVRISCYSGGTKRKLNTAIAMISNPYIIFLDEPTTGVDPKSRRFVWDCIKKLQISKKTLVLTSHSMDECEMLCNRLAIMAHGELKCIGYIQKLKEKFGKGFSLMVKLKADAIKTQSVSRIDLDSTDASPSAPNCTTDIKLKLKSLFPCDLKDEHEGILQYFIYSKNIQWAEVFSKLIQFSNEHESVIENFSINETTLEDIFMQFRETNSQTTEL